MKGLHKKKIIQKKFFFQIKNKNKTKKKEVN